ncbi:hypothetical protein [Hydrogenophaga sp. 2FB]|uniref:hypothetical protein n=1 Tax=Hydrogenophaga sp. 2FB TaxID=2502187 RepID=UPI0010F8A57F|nr:hypothetical protein [Hydrogenophaga sp. 2FB]
MTLIAVTVAEAVSAGRRRCFDEGQFRGMADYLFETAPGEEPGPQALVARQAPGWTLPVHFHMQYQFQVVLRGSGTLGKHVLAPGSVHYTSPQSGYGPILAGEDGLDYFTIRVLTDKGAWYLPEARAYMERGLFKEQQWGPAPDEESAWGWQTLIPFRPDGLGAWACTGQANTPYACKEPHSDAGRFHSVIRGSFRLGNRVLPPGSCVYWSPPDSPPTFTALEEKSLMIAVQFPGEALRHHVPPELRVAPSARGTPLSPN